MNTWVNFTRRTDDPKLAWMQNELAKLGIESRRYGHTLHAPILQVRKKDWDRSMEFLYTIDNIPDDDEQFAGFECAEL